MTGRRLRANASAWCAALAAAFAFIPFIPRLLRAAFTGRRDRERTLGSMRAGLATRPSDAPTVLARAPRILLVAGEPSGDLHAADLAAAILRAAPGASIEGIGGPRMAAAGVRVATDLVSDPVMGVWPVVRQAPRFFALYRDQLLRFEEDPPDVVVGVDYPGLNLRLARAARRRGVPFVEYIAPQVWAWAPWRTRRLARDVTRVVCILPFEEGIFRAAGTQASYVGHPLFEHLAREPRDEAFRTKLREGLGGAPLVALLPGSLRAEVRGNLPVQIDAAVRIAAARPGARFVIPLAAFIVLRVALYDNFRQILFILPPIFLMAGVAFEAIKNVKWQAALIALSLLPGVLGIVSLHPYEYIYYNQFVGGVNDRFETDYWATSYREAAEVVNGVASPNANVWVEGPAQLFSLFAREDLKIYSTGETERAGSYEYVVTIARYGFEDSVYPDAQTVHVIERGGAVLTVIKKP